MSEIDTSTSILENEIANIFHGGGSCMKMRSKKKKF